VASILGPFLGGRVFVATGEYRFAFYTAAAVSVVALAVLFAARNPHAERVSPTVARVAG
jgi:predicted MFS family arabinose efflux permease